MKISKLSGVVFVLTALLSITELVSADSHWSDEWEVEVDGKSTSSGTINFKITFEPGVDVAAREAVTVDVQVANDTGENDVAEIISNSFRAVLGDEEFEVDVKSGEKVEIESRGDTPNFVLEITASSIQGISLELDN
jgi:hypothetical protein